MALMAARHGCAKGRGRSVSPGIDRGSYNEGPSTSASPALRRPASVPGALVSFRGVGPRDGIDWPYRGRRPGSARQPAGGTVRWGLRAGHVAWPDRSAPASTLREFAFNALTPSSPRLGGLGVPLFPRLRRFGLPDHVLRGFASRTHGRQERGLSVRPGLRLLDGHRGLRHQARSGSSFYHRGQGAPPRAARVKPGQYPVGRPSRFLGRAPITRTTRGRPSFADGRTSGQTRPDDENHSPGQFRCSHPAHRPSGTIDDLSITGALSYASLPPRSGLGQRIASEIRPTTEESYQAAQITHLLGHFDILLGWDQRNHAARNPLGYT
jgi:hypothetical protein